MKRIFLPKTRLGKLSVGLSGLFLTVIAVSILLVNVFGVLSFGDRWWDVTVPIEILLMIVAGISGIVAVRKNKESSVFVYASIVLGVMTILFLFSHSLFLND